jgi:prophage regulatory protein
MKFHLEKGVVTMKLFDLLLTGKQIRTIAKSEIPNLLGELEMLKARLWARLMEWDELEPMVVLANTSRIAAQAKGRLVLPTQTNYAPKAQGRILRPKEVIRMIGMSRATIWRMEHDGRFPKHASLGGRSVGWLDTEIHQWIANRFENEGNH